MADIDDPFFDAHDLSHNLFATGYELDQEGFAVTRAGLPRDEPGDDEGLRVLDQDSLGRAVGLPVPDRDDIDGATELEVARARSRLRDVADRRGPAARVPGASGSKRDPERRTAEDPPRGSPGDTGDADERAAVARYLSNPTDRNARTNAKSKKVLARRRRPASDRPVFEGARFEIEMGPVQVLASGMLKMTFLVPYEYKAEALKLTDTPGLLLEASISPVEGRIK